MLEKRNKVIVTKSAKAIFAQLVDPSGRTLVGERFVFGKSKNKPAEQAREFGVKFAEKIKTKKVTKISFDRNGNIYHGRVKSFAEGMRDGKIEF